jgi:hypothetical protein
MSFWRRTNGIDVWSEAIDLAKDQTEKEYRGAPGDFQFSCAYGFAGDVLIELARHDGGRSVYKDWLDEGGRGPHHVGFRLHDADEYERATAVYADSGLDKAMAAFFQGDAGTCRWSYWDTRESIGCYTELYCLDGPAADAMARMRAGEVVSLT